MKRIVVAVLIGVAFSAAVVAHLRSVVSLWTWSA
jgi:hypothetical protein